MKGIAYANLHQKTNSKIFENFNAFAIACVGIYDALRMQ